MQRQTPASITSASRVVARHDHVEADLGGQAALLHLRSGVYFTLDPTGSWIWKLIQQPRAVREVAHEMAARYDASVERCEEDLVPFLRDLQLHGLLTATAEEAKNFSSKEHNRPGRAHQLAAPAAESL